jgi:hypothetical protein
MAQILQFDGPFPPWLKECLIRREMTLNRNDSFCSAKRRPT